jgi:hypothetical protein
MTEPRTEAEYLMWDGRRLIVAVTDEDPGDIGEPRSVDEDNTTFLAVRALLTATEATAGPRDQPEDDWEVDEYDARAALAATTGADARLQGHCAECGERWPCQATVEGRKDRIPHRLALAATTGADDQERIVEDAREGM